MMAANYSYLRNNMKESFDKIADTREPMIITRKSENMVIMSQKDYDEITETLYLLKDMENARHLFEAMKEIDEGKTVSISEEDLA